MVYSTSPPHASHYSWFLTSATRPTLEREPGGFSVIWGLKHNTDFFNASSIYYTKFYVKYTHFYHARKISAGLKIYIYTLTSATSWDIFLINYYLYFWGSVVGSFSAAAVSCLVCHGARVVDKTCGYLLCPTHLLEGLISRNTTGLYRHHSRPLTPIVQRILVMWKVVVFQSWHYRLWTHPHFLSRLSRSCKCRRAAQWLCAILQCLIFLM